ncbi:uncharacterized protein [Pithys albifrons albifrons]|uniref:uncharacterized protein n=1 Tax=Pithys albifrons albifrons TaxID=3385563 RepID=UPI003A5CF633
MWRWRGAGLAALAAVLLVAAGRAQVQQETSAETTEGTAITINCSHRSIQLNKYIEWYRQLPGRSPEFLARASKGSKPLRDPAGLMSVSADGRWSSLRLYGPRFRDAAVYFCALGDTGRGAGAAAGHEPPRAGPGGGRGHSAGRASRGRCHPARRARSGSAPRSAAQPAQTPRPPSPPAAAPAALAQRASQRHRGVPHGPGLPGSRCLLCLTRNCCCLPLCHPSALGLRPRVLLLSAWLAKQRDGA